MARSMRITRGLFPSLLALWVGGCAGQITEMPTWIPFSEYTDNGLYTDDGVVVLKVSPPASVLLAIGRIEQEGWREKRGAGRVWLSAKDGHVVAKASPAQQDVAYAVVEVRPDSLPGGEGAALGYETGFWAATAEKAGDRPAYQPTGQARVPVFKATAARVTFAGAIRIDPVRAPDSKEPPQKVGITPVTSSDEMEAVRRFMAERYPKVTARLQSAPLQMMRRFEPGE